MLIEYKNYDTKKTEFLDDYSKIKETFTKIKEWNQDLVNLDKKYSYFFDAILDTDDYDYEKQLSALRGYVESNTNIFANIGITNITLYDNEGLDRDYIERCFSLQDSFLFGSASAEYDRHKNWSTSKNKVETDFFGHKKITKTDEIADDRTSGGVLDLLYAVLIMLGIAILSMLFAVGWRLLLIGLIIYGIYKLYNFIKKRKIEKEEEMEYVKQEVRKHNQNNPDNLVCMNCGTKNKKDSDYCVNCGSEILK